jgi:hypothetical protein
MKWFHHDCTASHDPKLQILGATHGPEGLGIFWGLLEQIGQHSDTFHLKVLEFSKKSDKSFANLVENPEKDSDKMFESHLDLARVPRLPVKTLAKNVFTTSKTLTAVIATCVDVGLFDRQKWLKYNLLYSPSFERRCDDYTRRVQRNTENVLIHSEQTSNNIRRLSKQCSNNVRTLFGQAPDLLRTKSENVLLETEAEQKEKERKNRYRTEKDLFVKDTDDEKRRAKSDLPVRQAGEPANHGVTTSDYYELLRGEPYLISLTEEGFQEYSQRFRAEIARSNENSQEKIDWVPVDSQLRKLFFGGSEDHKLTLCYHAYRLLDEKVNYPELVLRALRLMLKASENTRISNPYGWILSCLHGNGDGTLPWVQLMTSEEEGSLTTLRRRRGPSDHPP